MDYQYRRWIATKNNANEPMSRGTLGIWYCIVRRELEEKTFDSEGLWKGNKRMASFPTYYHSIHLHGSSNVYSEHDSHSGC